MISIKGSVMHPGTYAFESGLTLKQVIAKADGVKEDAYMTFAFIKRKQENYIPEILGFNLGDVLNGNISDILLQKDDSITIPSLFEFREEQQVAILGAVKSPGTYPFVENMSIKDLIYF